MYCRIRPMRRPCPHLDVFRNVPLETDLDLHLSPVPQLREGNEQPTDLRVVNGLLLDLTSDRLGQLPNCSEERKGAGVALRVSQWLRTSVFAGGWGRALSVCMHCRFSAAETWGGSRAAHTQQAAQLRHREDRHVRGTAAVAATDNSKSCGNNARLSRPRLSKMKQINSTCAAENQQPQDNQSKLLLLSRCCSFRVCKQERNYIAKFANG